MKTILMVCWVGLMCLLFSSVVVAQTTSNIQGTVKDAKGAVVAGAEIKVTSTALSVERTATSDGDGFFRLAALPAGTYLIIASAPNFANSRLENVELTLNRTLTLEVELEVGSVKQSVA